MEFEHLVLAASWPITLGLIVGGVILVWTAFWTYVWFHYFPILLRLVDQQPFLVPEPAEPLDGGEECEFPTHDGLTLRGTYLKTLADKRLGVVLFGHELFGDRWNAAPYVRDLLREGYDILTFDLRNHGSSDFDPQFAPRPWTSSFDVVDVRAAIDYLATRGDADSRGIGMLGISRGGGAMLCAAAGDPRVLCVFTDGAYPSRTTHLLYMRRFAEIYVPRTWRWLCRAIPDWAYSLMLGAARRRLSKRDRIKFIDVEREAARVVQPVLMVHGERDTMIPVEVAHLFKACLAGPSKLWIVPEARHNGAIAGSPDEYQRRLSLFFGTHLSPRSGGNVNVESDSIVAA